MKNNKLYSPGDMCYFIDNLNKILMCEVVKKILEKDMVMYEVRDCTNWRYSVVEHKYCADKKIDLKGKKRESK